MEEFYRILIPDKWRKIKREAAPSLDMKDLCTNIQLTLPSYEADIW
jgi:hypothetical protein